MSAPVNQRRNSATNARPVKANQNDGNLLPVLEETQPALDRIEQLSSVLTQAQKRFGASDELIAAAKAIVFVESRGINLKVHKDRTGRGLIGLDTAGEMPAFERFVGGKYPSHVGIPTTPQLHFLVKRLSDFSDGRVENLELAVRKWHRPNLPFDQHVDRYWEKVSLALMYWYPEGKASAQSVWQPFE